LSVAFVFLAVPPKPSDGFRCHFLGTLAGYNDTLCLMGVFDPQPNCGQTVSSTLSPGEYERVAFSSFAKLCLFLFDFPRQRSWFVS